MQLMNNEEITNIVKILGLHYTKKYTDSTELRSLRYGKLLIMTDQDQDGSHIKGLVINFFHHNWPGLLRHSFVQQFITPIVKVSVVLAVRQMAQGDVLCKEHWRAQHWLYQENTENAIHRSAAVMCVCTYYMYVYKELLIQC